jgi:hypothetical protein
VTQKAEDQPEMNLLSDEQVVNALTIKMEGRGYQ